VSYLISLVTDAILSVSDAFAMAIATPGLGLY
jgi:hypothetical protein